MKGFLHDRFIPVATILAVIIALWYGGGGAQRPV